MADQNVQGVPQQSAPQSAPTASSSAAAPKKGGGAAVVIIIVLVILAVLGVGGYFVSKYVAKKAGEKITEGLLGAATGGKVDVTSGGEGVNISNGEGSLSLGAAAKWPSDMPSNVPQFTYGSIVAASKISDQDGWMALYEKVSADAQTKYAADLAAKGWTKDNDSVNVGVAEITQLTDGKNILTVTYDTSSKGATITVSPKASTGTN